ncbi:FMN-binding protein [bioreactor metagenome]|uniref:FMN-binding protein n=1 Tax=bioreactor metagenome TaxID=1076179 RepID=A0A645AX83_9ZZZZ
MLPEKFQQVLQHEGVVAIATQGPDGPHLVNSWNSYMEIASGNKLLIPAGYMNETETNIAKNDKVQLTVGSKEVEGFNGPGTGFLVKGTAKFIKSGASYESLKSRFPWMRAVLEITVDNVAQTL